MQTQADLEAALRHLGGVDGRMKELIERVGPPRFRSTRSMFQALVRAIVYQQLSGTVALVIYRRLAALFPHRSFPTPRDVRAVSDQRLREIGLSWRKVSYIQDLAQKFVDGTIRPRRLSRMSDREVAAHLTRVRGIGQWTVDMFLIFTLRRPDVFPIGDLGVQKGLCLLYGLDEKPDAETMERLAEIWRPYRSIATWYLWRAVEGELPGW